MKKPKTFFNALSFSKWCLQESNQGHKDFQSFALPTELRHLLIWDCKYIKILIFQKNILTFWFHSLTLFLNKL